MTITSIRALLKLNTERKHLQITHAIEKMTETFHQTDEQNLVTARLGILDLSFRRFKAGLKPMVNFVFSLSIRITFVAVFAPISAPLYLVLTKQIIHVWYGVSIFLCLTGVAVFIIGQYAAWKLWSTSKATAEILLDRICAETAENYSSLCLRNCNPNKKEIIGIEKEVDAIRKLNTDLDQISAVTYTSSSIFKLISVNFLAFGPLILEQLLFYAFFR
jgi:hypothetical protein